MAREAQADPGQIQFVAAHVIVLRFIGVTLKIGVNQNSTCALEQQWPLKFTTFIAGGTPYPAINNKELRNLLNSGYRLERPGSCSEEL